jgi:tetratricopeptide (TPR) repeat protein
MDKTLAKIETYILYAVVFLVPLAFAPISPNVFVPVKVGVLALGVALALLVKAVRIIVSGKLEFSIGSFDFPVLLLMVAFAASAIMRTPNKMEAFFVPGTATIFIASALLYFLINQLKDNDKENMLLVLFVSGAIYSFLMILSGVGVFSKIPQLPAYMKANTFSPGSGYLPSFIFLLALAPVFVHLFLIKKLPAVQKSLIGISAVVILFGLGLSVFNMLPGKPSSPRFPGMAASWSIAVDTLKESPFFGSGPGNYVTSFNRYRPFSFNNTDIWAVKFSTANNLYLTMLTETGLLGLAGLILLLLSVYRLAKREFKENRMVGWGLKANMVMVSLALLLIIFAILPSTIITTMLLFVFLSLYTKTAKTSLNLTTSAEGSAASQKLATKLPALLVTLPVIVLVILLFAKTATVYSAEYKFKKSVDALLANNAQDTYTNIQAAINANPLVDRYRITYSQINLLLANSMINNLVAGVPEGQTPEVTDQDRANIAQLVQQAIREAKAAVALNPLRASNWENLARVYASIRPLAQGADVFSAQTYAQAVALDPANPNLRIALGGIYYAAGDLVNAVNIFNTAAQVKPDLANAHYNLAIALGDAGSFDQAVSEMTTTLSLVDRNSQDYEVARQALDNLQSRRAEAQAQAGQNLTPPEAAQDPVLEPPLDLPEESNPPEAPLSPTPSPADEENEDAEDTADVTLTPTPTIIP